MIPSRRVELSDQADDDLLLVEDERNTDLHVDSIGGLHVGALEPEEEAPGEEEAQKGNEEEEEEEEEEGSFFLTGMDFGSGLGSIREEGTCILKKEEETEMAHRDEDDEEEKAREARCWQHPSWDVFERNRSYAIANTNPNPNPNSNPNPNPNWRNRSYAIANRGAGDSIIRMAPRSGPPTFKDGRSARPSPKLSRHWVQP